MGGDGADYEAAAGELMSVLELLEQADHWRRSEFAARCAEAVLPLFDKAWPDAVIERRAAIERTIRLTLTGAGSKSVPLELGTAIVNCRIVAGKVLRPLFPDGRPLDEMAPPDADSCRLAHFIASSAAYAAESLEAETESAVAARNAMQALAFAFDAAQVARNVEARRRLEFLIGEFEKATA